MIAADHRILTPDTRQVDWTQPVNWRDPLNDGLVSWWLAVPNHHGFGTRWWDDLTGRTDANRLRLYNPTSSMPSAWVPGGAIGSFGELEFDTTSTPFDELKASGTPPNISDTLNGTSDFTVIARCRVDTIGARRTIFSKGGVGTGSDYSAAMAFTYDTYFKTTTGNGWCFTIFDVGDDLSLIWDDSNVPLGEMVHMCCRYDSSAITADMFVNGQAATGKTVFGTPSYDGSEIGNGSDPLIIGSGFVDGETFDGAFSDVRIWNRALTADEIQDYYHRSQSYYPGLLNRHTRRSIFLPAAAEPDTGTGGSRRVVIPTVSTPDTRHVDWRDPVADHPLNDGLVSWWLAIPNHTSGTSTWRDLCGKNDGTLTNFANVDQAWQTQGQPGGFGALDFDGSDDYVIHPSIDTTQSEGWTIMVWLKRTNASQTSWRTIWRYGHTGSGVFIKYGTQELYIERTSVSAPAATTFSDLEFTNLDQWYHLAVSADSTTVRAYLDGVASNTTSSDTADRTWSELQSPYYPWSGSIANAAIYGRALTADEIQDYYHRSQSYYPGLLNRHTRRSIFLPLSTGVTISPDTLTMTGSLQGAPPNISRTINVT